MRIDSHYSEKTDSFMRCQIAKWQSLGTRSAKFPSKKNQIALL